MASGREGGEASGQGRTTRQARPLNCSLRLEKTPGTFSVSPDPSWHRWRGQPGCDDVTRPVWRGRMVSCHISPCSQNTEGMGSCVCLTGAFEMGDPFSCSPRGIHTSRQTGRR